MERLRARQGVPQQIQSEAAEQVKKETARLSDKEFDLTFFQWRTFLTAVSETQKSEETKQDKRAEATAGEERLYGEEKALAEKVQAAQMHEARKEMAEAAQAYAEAAKIAKSMPRWKLVEEYASAAGLINKEVLRRHAEAIDNYKEAVNAIRHLLRQPMAPSVRRNYADKQKKYTSRLKDLALVFQQA